MGRCGPLPGFRRLTSLEQAMGRCVEGQALTDLWPGYCVGTDMEVSLSV